MTDPELPVDPEAPTDIAPTKRMLDLVTVHTWPYGDGVWIQAHCAGDDVAIYNALVGGPRRYKDTATAMFKIGAELSRYEPLMSFVNVEVIQHVEPKPAPKISEGIEETAGQIHEGDIEITFGGACPIQGDGVVDGLVVYYRARATGWSLQFFPAGTDVDAHPWPDQIFEYREEPYAFPDGGWLHADESESNIRKAVAAMRDQRDRR